MMRFEFLDVIFEEKGLEIDTHKPPRVRFIWSYHTQDVLTKVGQRAKLTFSSNFDDKNSIKSS